MAMGCQINMPILCVPEQLGNQWCPALMYTPLPNNCCNTPTVFLLLPNMKKESLETTTSIPGGFDLREDEMKTYFEDEPQYSLGSPNIENNVVEKKVSPSRKIILPPVSVVNKLPQLNLKKQRSVSPDSFHSSRRWAPSQHEQLSAQIKPNSRSAQIKPNSYISNRPFQEPRDHSSKIYPKKSQSPCKDSDSEKMSAYHSPKSLTNNLSQFNSKNQRSLSADSFHSSQRWSPNQPKELSVQIKPNSFISDSPFQEPRGHSTKILPQNFQSLRNRSDSGRMSAMSSALEKRSSASEQNISSLSNPFLSSANISPMHSSGQGVNYEQLISSPSKPVLLSPANLSSKHSSVQGVNCDKTSDVNKQIQDLANQYEDFRGTVAYHFIKAHELLNRFKQVKEEEGEEALANLIEQYNYHIQNAVQQSEDASSYLDQLLQLYRRKQQPEDGQKTEIELTPSLASRSNLNYSIGNEHMQNMKRSIIGAQNLEKQIEDLEMRTQGNWQKDEEEKKKMQELLDNFFTRRRNALEHYRQMNRQKTT